VPRFLAPRGILVILQRTSLQGLRERCTPQPPNALYLDRKNVQTGKRIAHPPSVLPPSLDFACCFSLRSGQLIFDMNRDLNTREGDKSYVFLPSDGDLA
jgi:hypothetical protein